MPPDEKKKEPRKLAYVRAAKVTGKTPGKLGHKLMQNGSLMDGRVLEVEDFYTGVHMYTIKYNTTDHRWYWLRTYENGETSWVPIVEAMRRRRKP